MLKPEDPSITILSATYTLEYVSGFIDADISHSGTSLGNVVSENGFISFELFSEGVPSMPGRYELSGEFRLSNGTVLSFNAERVSYTPRGVRPFYICCEVEDDSGNGNPNPTPTVVEDQPVYGVTNLGIADFRRVEQEVCCYVPGEVSHIENIMAREFKERSTRSLTSSYYNY